MEKICCCWSEKVVYLGVKLILYLIEVSSKLEFLLYFFNKSRSKSIG